jgi:hypothetical protein
MDVIIIITIETSLYLPYSSIISTARLFQFSILFLSIWLMMSPTYQWQQQQQQQTGLGLLRRKTRVFLSWGGNERERDACFTLKGNNYVSFFVFSPSELIFGCFPFALEVVAGSFTAAHQIKMFKYLIGLLVGDNWLAAKFSKYRPTRNDLLRDTGQTVNV